MIEPRPNISFADFVVWEVDQQELRELIADRVVPFLAGSADHELITGNVFAMLHASVDPPCAVLSSMTIVQTASRIGKDGHRPDVERIVLQSEYRIERIYRGPPGGRRDCLAIKCGPDVGCEAFRVLEHNVDVYRFAAFVRL